MIIGFHGCDKTTHDELLYNHASLKASRNNYDWLGNGIYLWEQNLERAWEWAKSGVKNPKSHIKEPAVIGAVIDLGFCLNLLDSNYIAMLQAQYRILKSKMSITKQPMPLNKNITGSDDLLLRYLDCAVIEDLHKEREKNGEIPFDSVRGVFFEGDPIYKTSGFMKQSHIQICIRNPNCIKGFFEPREFNNKWRIP